jgi:uncharacterized protein YdeI (YjbR/CyaY-like superfamily)
MKKKIFSVDEYFKEGCGRCELGSTPDCKIHKWPSLLKKLRSIARSTELNEELKWSVPCYTWEGKNIFIISAFKDFAGLNFFKGALLKDSEGLLTSPGESSQSARYMKFTKLDDIKKLESTIKTYIQEAIELEKSGKKVEFKKNLEPIPDELIQKFQENPGLKEAFDALTPGRQRGYILHFSQPKQSKTREARIEKQIPKILDGLGFFD